MADGAAVGPGPESRAAAAKSGDQEKQIFLNYGNPGTGGEEPPPQLKNVVDHEAIKKAEDAHLSDGFFGKLAKNKTFEATTICVIMLNAVEIGWDADYSARWIKPDNLFEGPVGFIVCEVVFCIYFTGEILIRFLGMKSTCHCLKNAWFMFDSTLVSMMIFETVVIPVIGSSGPFAQLSMLRLLRLLRMTRMVKLMRAFPQILMIIKGMNAAVKAVFWVAILLVIVTFTWSILFVNEYHQGALNDDEVEEGSIEELFGSMGKAMLSLMVMGTILDDVTLCTDTIRATENNWMLAMFLVYVVLNSFTMMNLLVGILVEVVGSTAESEKIRLMEEGVKESITQIFEKMDSDGSGEISWAEFQQLQSSREVMDALECLDIKDKHFIEFGKLLFTGEGEDETLSFDELLDCICRLRPGAHVSALDFAVLKESVARSQNNLQDRIQRIHMLTKWLGSGAASDIAAEGQVAGSPRLGDIMQEELSKVSRADMITELRRRFDSAGHQGHYPKGPFAEMDWLANNVMAC